MRPIITLLTDFGTADGFVGAMKGVILGRCGEATVVDITHQIAPQDVGAGARALAQAAPLFPASTIHVVVVDPGVGTARRPLLLASRDQLFIGPDNGLLSLAVDDPVEARVLDRPELFLPAVSRTFHGRDVFASVAGHLAAGLAPEDCGSSIKNWTRLELPRPQVQQHRLLGQVLHHDHFGNLITNLDRQLLGDGDRWQVFLQGRSIGPILETFGDVENGRWVAYIGSGGLLEIAIRNGHAARHVENPNAEVLLCPR